MSRVAEAIAALEAKAEARIRDGLSRYGIVTADRVIGVPMGGHPEGRQGARPRSRPGRRALGERSL